MDASERHNDLPDAYLYGLLIENYEYALQSLASDPSQALSRFGDRGSTLLHTAAFADELEIIQLLLSLGADVNAKEDDGLTPLHYAASNGNCEAMKLLIRNGADVNAVSSEGVSVLFSAATARVDSKYLAVALLLAQNCNVDARSAVRLSLHDELRKALADPANLQEVRSHGSELLTLAIMIRNQTGVAVLLDAGVDPNSNDSTQLAPLILACRDSEIPHSIVHSLVKSGANLVAVDSHTNETAIQIASSHNRSDLVRLLAAPS